MKIIAFLFLLNHSLAFAMPGWVGGAEIVKITTFECFPPVPLKDFENELKKGMSGLAIPWDLLSTSSNSGSRLVFEKRMGFEIAAGRFVTITNTHMAPTKLEALTAPRAIGRALKGRRLAPIQKALLDLTDVYDLFINRQSTSSKTSAIFNNILDVGAMVFTDNMYGVVLSGNYRFLGLCAKTSEYSDYYSRDQFPKPSTLDVRRLRGFLFQFLNRPQVSKILSCEQSLTANPGETNEDP